MSGNQSPTNSPPRGRYWPVASIVTATGSTILGIPLLAETGWPGIFIMPIVVSLLGMAAWEKWRWRNPMFFIAAAALTLYDLNSLGLYMARLLVGPVLWPLVGCAWLMMVFGWCGEQVTHPVLKKALRGVSLLAAAIMVFLLAVA